MVWPLEVTAGGRVPCREEGKGWLAGLAGLAGVRCFLRLVTCWTQGWVAWDGLEGGRKVDRVWT